MRTLCATHDAPPALQTNHAPGRHLHDGFGDDDFVTVRKLGRVQQLLHARIVEGFVAEVELGVEALGKGGKQGLVVGGLCGEPLDEAFVAADRAAKHVQVLRR